MANPEQLKILKQGVEVWNRWSETLPLGSWPDLSGADLSGVQLNGANLHGANLIRANLTGTHLREADIAEADLGEANLSTADLSRADLSLSDLSGAKLSRTVLTWARLPRTNLRSADLRAADLSEADLRLADLGAANLSDANLLLTDFFAANVDGADFARATSNGTHFADLDLSTAKGLETVRHEGPSTVGIDTIYKSRGKIPEPFLRGCGVPENFIEYMQSLAGQAFKYYSCFISYSTKDQDFAERLHADLQAEGVRCWLATENLKIGDKFQERIEERFDGMTNCYWCSRRRLLVAPGWKTRFRPHARRNERVTKLCCCLSDWTNP